MCHHWNEVERDILELKLRHCLEKEAGHWHASQTLLSIEDVVNSSLLLLLFFHVSHLKLSRDGIDDGLNNELHKVIDIHRINSMRRFQIEDGVLSNRIERFASMQRH